MRYDSTGIVKLEGGKSAQQTTILPTPDLNEQDMFFESVESIRLDHLAHRFYNDARYWWVIAAANGIVGSMYAEPGTQLRIPINVQSVMSNVRRINSE